MPYNATAIIPPDEASGRPSLPMARVRKIINLDEDVNQCSANAAYVIAIAAEMFVQYMAQQSHNAVKSERKPRRNIQYKDVANAVARTDNLEFLTDVVPRTMSYKQFKKDVAKEEPKSHDIPFGQRTLSINQPVRGPGVNGTVHDPRDGYVPRSLEGRRISDRYVEPMDLR